MQCRYIYLDTGYWIETDLCRPQGESFVGIQIFIQRGLSLTMILIVKRQNVTYFGRYYYHIMCWSCTVGSRLYKCNVHIDIVANCYLTLHCWLCEQVCSCSCVLQNVQSHSTKCIIVPYTNTLCVLITNLLVVVTLT